MNGLEGGDDLTLLERPSLLLLAIELTAAYHPMALYRESLESEEAMVQSMRGGAKDVHVPHPQRAEFQGPQKGETVNESPASWSWHAARTERAEW